MSARQKILVTGGRGRLASIIDTHLDKTKYEVVLLSRVPDEKFQDIRKIYDGRIDESVAVIIHLGWSNYPSNSELFRAPWHHTTDNLYLSNLLKSLDGNVKTKLIFFSTGGAVYGNATGRPNKETDVCQPISWYGESKLLAEKMVSQRENSVNLRISNPYGKISNSDIQGVIPKIIRCAFDETVLNVWGDGEAQKDYLYYTDFVQGLDEIISKNLNSTYNLCSGKSVSINRIIKIVEEIVGVEIKVNYSNSPSWDVIDSRLDNSKITEDTDWKPLIDVDNQGISNTINDIKLLCEPQ